MKYSEFIDYVEREKLDVTDEHLELWRAAFKSGHETRPDNHKPPWKKRRERVLEALQSKISESFGVTECDPFLTVRWTDPKNGQFMTVQMVVSDCEVQIPKPEIAKGDEKAAKERIRKVRVARATDKWASPWGPLGWLCPESPTGYCWYDNEADPCKDHCLGCGHPKERK